MNMDWTEALVDWGRRYNKSREIERILEMLGAGSAMSRREGFGDPQTGGVDWLAHLRGNQYVDPMEDVAEAAQSPVNRALWAARRPDYGPPEQEMSQGYSSPSGPMSYEGMSPFDQGPVGETPREPLSVDYETDMLLSDLDKGIAVGRLGKGQEWVEYPDDGKYLSRARHGYGSPDRSRDSYGPPGPGGRMQEYDIRQRIVEQAMAKGGGGGIPVEGGSFMGGGGAQAGLTVDGMGIDEYNRRGFAELEDSFAKRRIRELQARGGQSGSPRDQQEMAILLDYKHRKDYADAIDQSSSARVAAAQYGAQADVTTASIKAQADSNEQGSQSVTDYMNSVADMYADSENPADFQKAEEIKKIQAKILVIDQLSRNVAGGLARDKLTFKKQLLLEEFANKFGFGGGPETASGGESLLFGPSTEPAGI